MPADRNLKRVNRPCQKISQNSVNLSVGGHPAEPVQSRGSNFQIEMALPARAGTGMTSMLPADIFDL